MVHGSHSHIKPKFRPTQDDLHSCSKLTSTNHMVALVLTKNWNKFSLFVM